MGERPSYSISAQQATLTAAGDGTASGTISNVSGEILGVQFTLGAGMVSAVCTLTSDTGQVILNGVTISANGYKAVRLNAVTNDGSTAITNSFIPYVAGGTITFAITSATAAKTITAKVFFR